MSRQHTTIYKHFDSVRSLACFSSISLDRTPSRVNLRARRRSCSSQCSGRVVAAKVEPGALVLVAGATGGVGQLTTAKLLERGYRVRAMTRNVDKARQLFEGAGSSELEIVQADGRDASSLPAAVDGVDAIVCTTGTTAFPSLRWRGGNGPEQTDFMAVKNLIEAAPRGVQRFLLTTSAGVERYDKPPWSILNLFGVLKYKKAAEELLQRSGLPYTIIRPNRLTDGPYTSYDLNTLLRNTAGSRRDVQLSARDDQLGETSRISVAEALVQALGLASTEGKVYAVTSTEGGGPGEDPAEWKALFESVAA